MSLTSLLINPETLKAHRATWFVWAGGVKMRRTAKMMGSWGYDVTCSCGWESRTGGATRTCVEDALFDHRHGAQAAAGVRTFFACPGSACLAAAGEPCKDWYGKPQDWMHPGRWHASMKTEER
jgi:hypothetical protein